MAIVWHSVTEAGSSIGCLVSPCGIGRQDVLLSVRVGRPVGSAALDVELTAGISA
jgi:hypothetical protein